MVQRLLKIPTAVRTRISLEEHRDPKDPDIIDLPAPTEQPVVDGGVGVGAPGAAPEVPVEPGTAEVVDPLAAPGAEVPPVADPATVPAADVTPPVTEDLPPTDEPGGTDLPPAEPATDPVTDPVPPVDSDPVPPVDAATAPAADPIEGAIDQPAPTDEPTEIPGPDTGDVVPPAEPAVDIPPVAGETPIEPATEPAPSAPVDSDPALPADTVTPPIDVSGTEPGAEPAPGAETPTEEMTSAWVDGVAVDAEEVKQHLEDAAAEVVDADNTTEELHEAAVALEELKAVISDNLAEENPIVSETTINLVHIEAEKALEKIGETHDIKSMESISSPVERLRLTLESLSEKAAEIWEAIKAALAKAWESVKAFFANIFDSATRVKNQLAKLKEAIDGVQGEPSEKTVENPTVFKAVSLDGKIDWSGYATVLSTLTGKMSNYVKNSPRAMQDVLVNAGNIMVKAVKDPEGAGASDLIEQFAQVSLGYADLCGKFVDELAPGGRKGKDGSWILHGTGPLPGGYEIQVRSVDKTAAEYLDAGTFGSIMNGTNVNFSQEATEGKDVPVMTKEQMSATLDAAIALIDVVFEGRAEVDNLQKAVDQMRADGQAAIVKADAAFFENVMNRQMLTNTMSFGTKMAQFNGRVLSMITGICAGAVRGLTVSIALYPNGGSAVVDGKAEHVAPDGAPQLPAPVAA